MDHFLKDFQLQKRLYLFFLKRIYAPLYKHFFDLTIGTGEAEEDEAQSFFLTECEEKKEEMKEEEGGGRGGTAEELAALETRWRRVLEEEYSIKSAPFEKEEGERENGELNCILQLLPDLSAKCQLGVQLASQWLEDYQQRHPEEQEEGEGASGGGGATEELKTLRKALLKKEGEMRRGEHSVTILEAELETLKAREERVFALCSNCAQLEKHRESLSEKYATLVQERQTLTTEIENTIQGETRTLASLMMRDILLYALTILLSTLFLVCIEAGGLCGHFSDSYGRLCEMSCVLIVLFVTFIAVVMLLSLLANFVWHFFQTLLEVKVEMNSDYANMQPHRNPKMCV